VLVVEDEYLIAADLADVLKDAGADVIGPVASVREALELVETFGDRLDGAVLDVNLREERVFPVAEALARRGIPYIFTTGYDSAIIPELHANAPRHKSPSTRLFCSAGSRPQFAGKTEHRFGRCHASVTKIEVPAS